MAGDFIFPVIAWLIGFFLMWHIPTLRERLISREPRPRISVIIPARNEALRIGRLLESLRRQTLPPDEVIVMDDQSTDSTAQMASGAGAWVISSAPLPEGWAGKPWACWQGARASQGEVLVFLDADTWLEPDALEKLVRAWLDQGGMVTLQPYHETQKLYEQLSMMFNVVLMAGTNAFTPFGGRLKPGAAFGPCIVCGREDYFRVGGHAEVAGAVLEDIGLARRFLAAGLPVHCYSGRGTIAFRMYPNGFRQLVEGWTKSMAIGAGSIRFWALLLSVTWIVGAVGVGSDTLRALLKRPSWVWVPQLLLYAAYAGQIRWMSSRIGRFQPWTSLFYPIPTLFFILIMMRSFLFVRLLGRVPWRGRTVRITQE
ncbi:MAG: glycosyltransferase [Anaerolineae bacterium]